MQSGNQELNIQSPSSDGNSRKASNVNNNNVVITDEEKLMMNGEQPQPSYKAAGVRPSNHADQMTVHDYNLTQSDDQYPIKQAEALNDH